MLIVCCFIECSGTKQAALAFYGPIPYPVPFATFIGQTDFLSREETGAFVSVLVTKVPRSNVTEYETYVRSQGGALTSKPSGFVLLCSVLVYAGTRPVHNTGTNISDLLVAIKIPPSVREVYWPMTYFYLSEAAELSSVTALIRTRLAGVDLINLP